jgi:hypothetical protein
MKRPPIAGFSLWCAVTIFLAALLVFQVQPIISKTILPWFGGSPAVWTTCLLFFQTVLLAGYVYAHLLTRLRRPSRQALIHAGVAAVALILLPITPGEGWKPASGDLPTVRILVLLTACVGLPYFLLAGTSPLVQAWFARAYPGRSPYRLYALSNVGSLGGLLSYPLLVEPTMRTTTQGVVWSGTFVVYAACCGWIAIRLWRAGTREDADRADGRAGEHAEALRPGWGTFGSWLLLPTLGSVLLLAVTNHLCQNLAVIPLLWILPLTVYLLSFIICFDREAWYVRRYFGLGALLAVLAASYLALGDYLKGFWEQLGYGRQWYHLTRGVLLEGSIYLAALFFLCMVCHGELVRRKPAPQRLTSFYLTVAAGGALGGLVVAVLCPLIFASYLELNLALLLGFVLAAWVFVVDAGQRWFSGSSRLLRRLLVPVTLVCLGTVLWGQWEAWDREKGLVRVRDFYGVLSIRERYPLDPELHGLALYHGGTLHGFEHLSAEKRGLPTTYYTEDSGVGKALTHLRGDAPLRVGIVGLGAGTLAAYGKPGDYFRFYEIDPLVIQLSQERFTFLSRCAADCEIVPGDARLSLEGEPPQEFNVLVLDAFSGDTVPVHLLTAEAFDVYLRHLKPDGVIAVHVSSRYVDLVPVVMGIARHYGLTEVLVRCHEEEGLSVSPSDWMLLTRNKQFLQQEPILAVSSITVEQRRLPLWTDQENNLLEILR